MRDLFGIQVIESHLLPIPSSDKQDARRIVRHGLADVLEWLGEEVGPKPGAATHALIIDGNLHASAALIGQIRAEGEA